MGFRDLFDTAGGISRRKFAVGTAAAGAATMAAISLGGCSDSSSSRTEGEPQVVEDSSSIVDALDDYESKDLKLSASQEWSLSVGTLLFHSEGSWAAAMMTPESAVHPNTIGVFSLSSGNLVTLISDATKGTSYTFYDVRCGTGVLAWVEMDYREGSWYLMAQSLGDGALSGEATQLDHGDSNWEPPMFTCTGTSVIWQRMPLASGNKSSESSHCYLWKLGDTEGQDVWESPGRFATHPRVSNDILTIAPRVRADEGTYYGMTAVDLTDGEFSQLDQLVLPSTVKPFDAVYTGKEFAFSIEASYDSAGSLGNMGTFIGREGGPYVYFGREPVAQVTYSGSRFLIKTQGANYLVDTDKEQYDAISSPDRSIDMGDFPASEGSSDTALLFATIRDADGIPASVTARTFSI